MRKPMLIGIGSFAGVLLIGLLIYFLTSGGSGGGSSNDNSVGSGDSSVIAPKPQVGEAGPFSVRLNWTQPSGEAEVDHYTIYRDQALVKQVDGTSFTDENLTPGTSYEYEIRAVGRSDSASAIATVQAPFPPLGDARVDGTFKVFYKVRATNQFHVGDTFGDHWMVRPTCDEGACSVAWSNTRFTQLRTTLVRSGGTYRGRAKGYFGLSCSGKHEVANVSIVTRVLGARAGPGTWTATRLTGTVMEIEPPQLGCNGARTTYSITVTRGT